jgi:hypothetical protein
MDEVTLSQMVGVLEGVFAAIAHAAARGIVHGDLSPENVFVTEEGGVKVADFGVAEAFLAVTSPGLTALGMAFASATYVAPEQLLGRSVGPWTDLYAVGGIAYELAVGMPPFAESAVGTPPFTEESVLKRLTERPTPPQAISPNLDPRLAGWIGQLLEGDPDDRPASAGAAFDDLDEIALSLLGPRWRRGARLLDSRAEAEPAKPLTPAPFPDQAGVIVGPVEGRLPNQPPAVPYEPAPAYPALRSMLRDAALAGVIPGVRREPITPPATPATAAAAPPPMYLPPQTKRPSMLWRIAVPLAALGALAVGAKWLLGLLVESDEAVTPAEDWVECTVFAPPSATPGTGLLVQVFVHLPEEAADARAIATELDVDARRRAFRSLDARVRIGNRLDFDLRLPGLVVDEPTGSLVWRRRTDAVQFGVRVPPETAPGTIIGTLSVAVNSVPLGHVKFKLAIDPGAAPASNEPQGDKASRYRFAFISYSSMDRDEVVRRVQLLQAVGIEYFQDVLSLEPGDRWLKRIELGIDRCDLFLLFWSSEAKRSEWVRQEVRHALARKAGDDTLGPEIRPVIIEGPPIVEPWAELAHLHFNDQLLYVLRAPDS